MTSAPTEEADSEAEGGSGDEVDIQAEGGEAEATPPAPPSKDPRDYRIEFLQRQLEEREATLHTYIRAHKKSEAEFDAFRARLERDQARELLAAKGKIIERMLELDENLERTIEATERGGSTESLLAGVRLVHRMFVERLGELGLERVEPTGLPFDPATMDALGVVPVTDPKLDNRVIHTIRAGFRLGEREIRPALVQVGRRM